MFSKPAKVDNFASDWMTKCWTYLPQDRPSFTEICAGFKSELSANAPKVFRGDVINDHDEDEATSTTDEESSKKLEQNK